jgi:hypothetical protein
VLTIHLIVREESLSRGSKEPIGESAICRE